MNIEIPEYLTIPKGTKISCIMIIHPRIRKFMDENKDKFDYDPVSHQHTYTGFDRIVP